MTKRILVILCILALPVALFSQAQPAGQPTAQPTAQPAATDNEPANLANPTPYEPTPGELVTEEINEAELSPEQREVRDRNLRAEEIWKNADYRDYNRAFAELHQLSKAFANNKYRLALSSYQSGVNTIIKMRDEVELYRKESAETKRLNEKWYWQIVDRKAKEERVLSNMRRTAKLEAVTYFTRAINHLDEIKNPDLREKPAFKKLLAAVYRNWIMYQFDLGNLPQTIPILELYIEIDQNEKEYPAHKYLAQAYSFQENMIRKYGVGTEDQMFRFRYKKNVHLLRATELKYGKESAEYKHVVNLVNRDEIISVQP
ncbi:MAG: PT domain-containing protein [Leptospirales bacterium]|nr:PT domain-containing protein [Leptospirales bacterium]